MNVLVGTNYTDTDNCLDQDRTPFGNSSSQTRAKAGQHLSRQAVSGLSHTGAQGVKKGMKGQ